jgi:hypothetical protein
MRNQNANVSDRSNARIAVVHAVVRRRRRAADLSGGKHDDFAAGSGEVPDRAERAKTALTIFEGTFSGSDKHDGRAVDSRVGASPCRRTGSHPRVKPEGMLRRDMR